MINSIKTTMNRTTARLALIMALFISSIMTSFADNTVIVEDFNIQPGQEKVVPVVLNNSDNISSLQMDITLPEGIMLVNGEVTRNEDRLLREDHSITTTDFTQNGATKKMYRVAILTVEGAPIAGNSGAIFYLRLKADNSFIRTDDMTFSNIYGSAYGSGQVEIIPSGFNVKVSPYTGFAAIEEDSLSIKPNGKLRKISVTLNNDVTASGFSADITLPEGLDIEKRSGNSDSYKFEYSSRLPQNATIRSHKLANGDIRIVISSLDAKAFTGNEGTLFSFNVTATDKLAKESNITIKEAMISYVTEDKDVISLKLDSTDNAKIINAYLAYYEPAKTLVDSLQHTLDAAIVAVDTLGPDVKDSVVFVNTLKNITDTIAKMSDELEKGYADETLTYLSLETKDKFEATLDSIEKYVADITAAQEAFDADEAKKAANEEAYARLSATIANMQVALDQANDSIAKNYADVAEMFKSDADSIQNVITETKEMVDSTYAVVGLNEESEVDSASVLASIETMVAEAKAAQEAFDAEEAKKAANEEAYARLSATIANMQATLDQANDSIAKNYADVAEMFKSDADSIQNVITETKEMVDSTYAVVGLNEESEVDSASVLESIETMIAEAKAAQEAFDADEAKKAANEEAYARLSAEIALVQKALNEANDTISEKCPDVASDFTNKIDSIQAVITELNDSIETAYEAVELNEESEIDTESIVAAIEALIAEAKEAQKEYEISSGIFGIEMSGDNKIVGIYTISGTKVHTPTKGQINIFKFADGSVKKCFVK